MITLRNFNISDVPAFLQNSRSDMNVKEAEKMICRWNQKLENGKYNPSLKLAMDIAKVFGKRVEEVFMFEDSDEE